MLAYVTSYMIMYYIIICTCCRFVFNPACSSEKDLQHLKFLGVLFGVAIRTKKPIQLHIAPPMWKLLVGMSMTAKDLEDVS